MYYLHVFCDLISYKKFSHTLLDFILGLFLVIVLLYSTFIVTLQTNETANITAAVKQKQPTRIYITPEKSLLPP